MRNGNIKADKESFEDITVLILPMRNGNLRPFLILLQYVLRSYPTYEECKQLFFLHCLVQPHNRSYPTYEEWKLIWTNFVSFQNFSSYPTYEEWKQHSP